MGIFLGGIIGFALGKWLGMFLGAWLGHQMEQQITGGSRRFPGGSHKSQTQASFFQALFLTLGKLAKVDGAVSQAEIDRAERIMQHMQLTPEMRQQAIKLFNQGKQSGFSIDPAIQQLARLSRRSLSLRQFFLEMLIDVAEADGLISAAEQQLIIRVCSQLRYPLPMLQAMLKMRGFGRTEDMGSGWKRESGSQNKKASNRQMPFNPYQVLGVSEHDNKPTIRRAYKRLMSQHHPDKLIAKGLPPEMMKVAEEKAKQVQLAWERVKELKGW